MERKPRQSTENFIKDIRRKTRRVFSSEQKIMIVWKLYESYIKIKIRISCNPKIPLTGNA
jgi:hypothetical protein